MATVVAENSFKFTQKEKDVTQPLVTNSSTRDWAFREMVAVPDGNSKYLVGFVSEADGIAAGASGRIDTFQNDVVTTNQVTVGAFTAGNVTVYLVPQDNSNALTINVADASGRVAFNATVKRYDASTPLLELHMPWQDGSLAATV